ncbi:MAG: 1-acyl-sn-glycerol-3-phosphate acyltransferase [Rhodobacteraceae bacterium]|nr:1-acyl-sn-glycerol-3-phosphate acyltransferase [Paracoccaceae bacterium]
MTATVTLPLWLFLLIVAFAAVTFASHFLFPSVRWFFRRRLERAVAQLNQRLARPIRPFKLAERSDTIQRLVYDPDVARGIIETARREGIPENVAFERARRYAREIVPSFSAFTYFSFGTRAARWLSQALYRVRTGYVDDGALAAIDSEATIIFVMNHRSNFDYVLVTYLVAERSALSYAVGEWARIWPLQQLIRWMGGYFIRRRAEDSRYRRVLARYVQMATAGGVIQGLFPEGGLSLDGGMNAPKTGILSYILDGQLQEGARDVVFVPVALNYDRVLEDRVLLAAGAAKTRRFRVSPWALAGFLGNHIWLRLTRRFYRFGYASVSFGRPVALSAFQAGFEGPREEAARALGRVLMKAVGDVVPVLPVPVVASILLERDGIDRSALQEAVRSRLAALRAGGAHVHIPRDRADYAAETGLRMLLSRRIVAEREGRIYACAEEQPLLAFYARSIAHLPLGDPEADSKNVSQEIARTHEN